MICLDLVVVFQGNYWTQIFSAFLASIGIFLLTLSTWQYTITEPQCCYNTLTHADGHVTMLQNWSGNCTELHRERLWSQASLHMSPDLLMATALIGIVVCMYDTSRS